LGIPYCTLSTTTVTERKPPFFPSELAATKGERIDLAGRVVAVEPDAVRMADAFTAVRVAGALDVEAGDLVIVSVNASGSEPVALGLVERHRRASRPGGEDRPPTSPSGEPRAEQTRFLEEGVGPNLRARAEALARVRSFFTSRAFLEVDTPLLVPSPGLDLHLDAVEAHGGYLITSPEYQMKRLLVAGVPRLFQVSHVFRRGELGARHNPEFTMLEWYRAFAGVDDVMRDTEELVADVCGALGSPVPLTPPFSRIAVCEAFARFASVPESDFFAMAESDSDAFFRILVEKVEPALASLGPTFLVDYPISHASLARAKPDDPRVCERFELYVAGIELCNGFGELTDPTEQRRRFALDQATREALAKPVYPVDERFVAALDEGMPPSAGNALGLDRLIALCLGEAEIARVMPFPADIV
jgi:lysyl-tRNA synthetase class 2